MGTLGYRLPEREDLRAQQRPQLHHLKDRFRTLILMMNLEKTMGTMFYFSTNLHVKKELVVKIYARKLKDAINALFKK